MHGLVGKHQGMNVEGYYWRTQTGGGGSGLQPPPPKKKLNLKNTYFVNTIFSKDLRDLRGSLKSATEIGVGILRQI